jgi:large subunit ribosomal protein L33
MREIIDFECLTCKDRNYSSTRNKKSGSGRLERKKFCPKCRKHTPHKETK